MDNDIIVYPVLVELATRLEAELTASEIPVPGFLALMPGVEVPRDFADGECDGQGWVRLSSVYPSTNFPEPDVTPARTWTQLGFDIEVGISRCLPTLDENNEPPTVAQNLAAVALQLADMAAMRRAICKTMVTLKRDFVLGSYTPEGPDGGTVGGYWPTSVRWFHGDQDQD